MSRLAVWRAGPVVALALAWLTAVAVAPVLWLRYEAARFGRAVAAFAQHAGATEFAVDIDWVGAAPGLAAFFLAVGVAPAAFVVRRWRRARRDARAGRGDDPARDRT
jgi:hypothetical protein